MQLMYIKIFLDLRDWASQNTLVQSVAHICPKAAIHKKPPMCLSQASVNHIECTAKVLNTGAEAKSIRLLAASHAEEARGK